LQTKRLSLIR